MNCRPQAPDYAQRKHGIHKLRLAYNTFWMALSMRTVEKHQRDILASECPPCLLNRKVFPESKIKISRYLIKSERSATDESGEGFCRSGGINASYTAFAAALLPIASIISTCSSDHSSSVTEMTWGRCSQSKWVCQDFSSYSFIIIFAAQAHAFVQMNEIYELGDVGKRNSLLRCAHQDCGALHNTLYIWILLYLSTCSITLMEMEWIEVDIVQVQISPSHLCTIPSQNASG